MEEVKKEEIIQEVKEEVKVEDNGFISLKESIEKLLKDNDILKQEIINLKNSQVSVNPEKIAKTYEKHTELWKEKF